MSFILAKESFLRKLILGTFILAMLGPWSYDLVSVPAQFPCNGFSVRLVGDYCGLPVSGFGGTLMVSISILHRLSLLINGYFATLRPELTAFVIMLFVFLPIFSSLTLVRRKNSSRTQVINLIAWLLGGLAASNMLAMQMIRPQVVPVIYLVWGIWLYFLVVIGAITLELLVLRANAGLQTP